MGSLDLGAELASLKVWNVLLGLLFTCVCIILVLSLNYSPKSQREISIYRGSIPPTTAKNICVVDQVQELKTSAKRDPYLIILIIFSFSAAAHFYYAFSKTYERFFTEGFNIFRWAEYGITGGLIGYLVSILSGEKQENSSLLIGLALLAGYLQFPLIQQFSFEGTFIEKLQSPAGIALLNSGILLGGAWYTILRSNLYLYVDASNANTSFSRPNFIYVMLLTQWFSAVLFFSLQARHVFLRTGSFISTEKQALAFGSITKLAFAATMYWGLCYKQKGC
jgi:hypothetical protein